MSIIGSPPSIALTPCGLVSSNGYVGNSGSSEFGVRPVVSLKSNVKTSAMDTKGRWIIEIEGRNRMGEVA